MQSENQNMQTEIAFASAIMADHALKRIYDSNTGYMAAIETIATYATEFYAQHSHINIFRWHEFYETTDKKIDGQSIDGYDDYVMAWIDYQLAYQGQPDKFCNIIYGDIHFIDNNAIVYNIGTIHYDVPVCIAEELGQSMIDGKSENAYIIPALMDKDKNLIVSIPQKDHIIEQGDDWRGTTKQWIETNLLDPTVTSPSLDEVRAVLSLGKNKSTQVGLFTIKRIA